MNQRPQRVNVARQAIRTPRAAAVAGIVFTVLFTISMVLMRLAIPEELSGSNTASWLQGNTTTLTLALTLVPFSGIAFLWFMGVVRDRLGKMEDQFFSTVFSGSGLLFLSMIFASAAIAGGILSSYAISADTLTKSGVILFGRAVMYTITKVYAVRMAGVFMISLGTLWLRTRVMPRVFVFITYALALVLLVSSDITAWLVLVLPTWVFVISIFILIVSLRLSPDVLAKSGVLVFGRAVMYTIMKVYAVRMAGVFMVALATLWMRTGVMPRVYVFLSYALALVLLVSSDITSWLILVFPAWVFVISVFILIESLRGELPEAEGMIGSNEPS